jgi:hypothetical protein
MPTSIADLEAMVAAGASAQVLLCAIKPVLAEAVAIIAADAKRRERMREGNRNRVTRYRALHQRYTSVTNEVFSLLPSEQNIKGRKKNKTPRKTLFPDPWPWPIRLEDQAEFENFKKHALENVRRSARWDMTWERWQASPYRKSKGAHGNGRPLPEGNISVAQVHELADEWRRREAQVSGGDLFRAPDNAGSNRRSG